MEEITTRFEIVRLAATMADHETIAIQAKKLRELSLDADLNEIIALLESRNYRQGLYLMKGYVNSLDDSFFNDTPPAPKKRKVQEPPQEAQNLFDMMQPQTPKTINLDDMLRMTEESAEESVTHSEPALAADTYVDHLKEEVRKNEAYLDIHKNRAENKEVKPFEPSEEEILVDIEGNTVKKEDVIGRVEEQAEPVVSPLADAPIQAEAESLHQSEERAEPLREQAAQESRAEERLPEAAEAAEVTASPAEPERVPELDHMAEEPVASVEVDTAEHALEEVASEPAPEREEAEQSPLSEHLDGSVESATAEAEQRVESLLTTETEEVDTAADAPQREIQELQQSSEEISTGAQQLFEEEAIAPEPQRSAAVQETEPDQSAVTEASSATKSEQGSLLREAAAAAAVASQAERLITEEEPKRTPEIKRKEDYNKDVKRYPPISYIDQKFRNMRHQFPQVEEVEEGIIDEVKALLKQMSTQGYSENDIKDAISFFQQRKAEGRIAEAAQMLLIAAASESKYAQLLLARELFKGEVLKTDYPEAFTQINRLAEHDYPEAICDLAQLYEYGYGIKKDKKTAQLLYEEAAQMGVARAQKHVERLSRKKGILSSFFK